MVDKCGGGWSRELKTVTHDGVWNGTVSTPLVNTTYLMYIQALVLHLNHILVY